MKSLKPPIPPLLNITAESEKSAIFFSLSSAFAFFLDCFLQMTVGTCALL